MSLTNFLLLLILSIFTTYTFMSWKGIDKGPKLTIIIQFLGWTILFFVILTTIYLINSSYNVLDIKVILFKILIIALFIMLGFFTRLIDKNSIINIFKI